MKDDRISARQLMVLVFTALLSPMVRALPAWTAGTAGEGAWLTGLFALPPLLVICWLLLDLLRDRPEGQGLADVFRDVLGPALGKGLTVLYFLWALLLLSLNARLYGERMLAGGYRNASLTVFLLALLGMVLWMGRKKLAAFVRAGEIFYLVLSIALGLVLVFSLSEFTPENVLPIWVEDIPRIASATLVPLGTVGGGIFAAFLTGHVTRSEGDLPRGVRWLCAGCVVMAALQFGVLAQLGPVMGGQLNAPFFEVAKGVGVSGAFQRMESIVIALWVLSDLALLGLLTFSCRTMARSVLEGKGERWVTPIIVVVAFFGALFLFPDYFAAKKLDKTGILLGNLILGFAVPTLLWGIQQIKKWGRHV